MDGRRELSCQGREAAGRWGPTFLLWTPASPLARGWGLGSLSVPGVRMLT